jgi:hypothetical protein
MKIGRKFLVRKNYYGFFLLLRKMEDLKVMDYLGKQIWSNINKKI